MIGSAVERQGIIRHGAKMIAAMSSAEVPRFCVVLRKAFAAGYYAMSSPGFEPRATIALAGAQIGAMAGEAAVNAVWANRIAAIEDDGRARARSSPSGVAEHEPELDAIRLASELLIDAVIEPEALRGELERRLADADGLERSRARPPPRGVPGMSTDDTLDLRPRRRPPRVPRGLPRRSSRARCSRASATAEAAGTFPRRAVADDGRGRAARRRPPRGVRRHAAAACWR